MLLRRFCLAALLGLAACAAPTGSELRRAGAPISSAAAFEPARFAGRWHVVASYGDEARCGPLAETWGVTGSGRYRVTGTRCGPSGARAFIVVARVSGPGRITRAGLAGREELWVLWTDAAYRVAVIGTPSGSFARVMSRSPELRPDLLQAARDVLTFNGYDPAGLTPI